MLPTDTLTCEILPNAVERDSLSCSMPPLENLDLWATNASVTSAAFTAFLALFAYMAWRKQKETLKKMEEQIVATARQTVDSRQVGFLVTYVQALKTAAERCDRPSEVLLDLTTAATDAWMVWSMDLFKSNPPMREMTQWWNGHYAGQMKILRANADALTLWAAQNPEEDSEENVAEYEAARDEFFDSVGSYIANLQMWQVDEEKRDEVFRKLAKARVE